MDRSATLAAGALGSLAVGRDLVTPRTSQAAEVKFVETRCGEKTKRGRVLIAYASRCGSTGWVAEAIGCVFCDSGASVDVLQVGSVKDLTPYRAVVIGSAIRSDQWLSETSDFVYRNRDVLSRLPVAYFLSCLTLSKPTEENRKKALGFLQPVHREVPEVRPVDTGLFGGVLDYDKLSFMVRMVMKVKMKDKGVAEGDYRDWESIRSWARGVAPSLLNGGGSQQTGAS